MKREARIFKKIIVILMTSILILGIGTSDVALGFKVVTIALLSIVGIRFLVGSDNDDADDDHIVFG